MDVPLRCENKLHGIVINDGVVEIKCNSRFCGAEPGVVVLHRFDTSTGEITQTLKFQATTESEVNK